MSKTGWFLCDDDVPYHEENGSESYNGGSVKYENNHIYFYNTCIDNRISLDFIRSMDKADKWARSMSIEYDVESIPVYIHINSPGGSVSDGIACMDRITRSKSPVVTIVEGCAASAATLLSVVSDKRMITENSYMLIHQVSSSMWGPAKFRDMKDKYENMKTIMSMLKDVYRKNTKIKSSTLDEILDHDLYFDAKTCKKYGLVDEIV